MMVFVIWSVTALFFVWIGISAWRSEKPMGFFTFTEPPKVKDVEGYNHAVAKLLLVFALIFEIIGVPVLFCEQNSPVYLFLVLAIMLEVIAVAVIYTRIERKFKV